MTKPNRSLDVERSPDLTPSVSGPSARPRPRARARAVFALVWSDQRLAFAVMAALVCGWGLLAGWWTPRGPVTTSQALSAVAISAAVGLAAGFVLRSRWAVLLAPAGFVVVFELARIRTGGPTVDGPHVSTYGVMALVIGRGFHGLLVIVPMMLAASAGASIARLLSVTSARGAKARTARRRLVRRPSGPQQAPHPLRHLRAPTPVGTTDGIP